MLFQLDPRPFEAALRQAEAALARDRGAGRERAARRRPLQGARREGLRHQVAGRSGDRGGGRGGRRRCSRDRAAVDNARLNLNYATIRAPIAGRTGRLLVRRGNLVKAKRDPLVVINQLQPILVRFPVVQHDFPSLQRRFAARQRAGARHDGRQRRASARSGTLAFLDNAVDSLTGTVTAKARFRESVEQPLAGRVRARQRRARRAAECDRRADARGARRAGRQLCIRRR